MDQDPGSGSVEGAGVSDFFSLIQEGAPIFEEVPPSPKLTNCPTKKELHWDSPPQSPSTPFVHLPYSVLQIVATGTKADAVVVGLFQDRSIYGLETLLYLPKSLNFAEFLEVGPDLLSHINGKVTSTKNLDLPVEFTRALGRRPVAFLAYHFSLEKYNGVLFGLWNDSVRATAEDVFADAVQSLPMLLSNRINARKYEHLGRRFDAILKVMPEAVVFVDDGCAQVVINPAAAALLELPTHGEVDPSKVAGAMRKLTERCSTRTDPQHWMRLLTDDDELEIEEDWELKDPRRVLHVRSYPVSSDAAHGRLWLYEDVTAPRAAEEAIEAANKGKSQFLAMMSHELRTPMTGVLGMLDLLQLTSLVPEQQGLMKIMQESAEGLMEVINNILDFCKIEAGRLILEEIDFSLSDTLEQIYALSKKDILEKGLELKMVSEPGARNVVRGDPVRLRQILKNLVSNAIKFTERGCVTVSWRYLDSQCFDATVSETSSSPVKRSDYISQILQARQGNCTIKQTTALNGRSVLTVDCSAGGASTPHAEASCGSNLPSVSTPREYTSHFRQKILSSGERTSSDLKMSRKRLASDAFGSSHSGEKFSKREIASVGQISSVSSCLTVSNEVVLRAEPSGIKLPDYAERLTISVPSEDRGLWSAKSPRLFPEHLKMSQKKPPKDCGQPHCIVASGAREIFSQNESDSSVPVQVKPFDPTNRSCMNLPIPDLSVIKKAVEQYTAPSITSGLGSQERNPTVSSNDSGDNFCSVSASDANDQKESRASGGLQICKVCDGVIYTANSERVEEFRRPDEKVWLEVKISDTGVGIGDEQLRKLFLASQAGSQRRDAAGTGLGLAICKGLLGLLGGKFQFESKVGEGTTVTVTVPLLPAEEAVEVLVESVVPLEKPVPTQSSTSQASSQQSKTSPKKSTQVNVLVAEDNIVNQLLIRKMFRHYGHVVDVVGNGKLAVEAVQKKAFDLVLMDVQMPILDGLSATKAIRGLPAPVSRVPIYALSADTPGSGPMEETGLDGYLCKPIAWEKMSGLVEKILAAKNGES
ncbi:protein MpPAS6 [Marchantia polymorpha subsp. ruderalis]|nr:hypothetical protein MARPO_0046s0076 [Marchantia polymorpha]BBN15753.1 hypothetical protein Mp_7g00490 [Marchantia polymorpha subsp. ruderalis]|eukprot:PTQ39255.1 hypothetical protein MARPO_0046s0076 [Marchantia polymorpha]